MGSGRSFLHEVGAPRLRYSPSPIGYCHLGLARTALLLDLLRRSDNGTLLMRLDDLVGARAAAMSPDAPLLQGLRALGITFDYDPWNAGPFGALAQSARLSVYRAALDQLVERDLAYPCTCKPRRRIWEVGPCQCPISGALDGEVPVYRFRATRAGVTRIRDLVCGETALTNQGLPDPVLIRSDGRPTYYLAYPADDAALLITLPTFERSMRSTQLYLQIREALGQAVALTVHLGKLTPPPREVVSRVLGEEASPFDLASYLSVGVPPSDVVLMLLHSLFGTWRGPYPDDLDAVAAACPWKSLKSVHVQLPLGVLSWARRRRTHSSVSESREPQSAQGFTLVVQVDGRVRDRLPALAGLDERTATDMALRSEKIQRCLAGRAIRAAIYRPGRLVNLVVEPAR